MLHEEAVSILLKSMKYCLSFFLIPVTKFLKGRCKTFLFLTCTSSFSFFSAPSCCLIIYGFLFVWLVASPPLPPRFLIYLFIVLLFKRCGSYRSFHNFFYRLGTFLQPCYLPLLCFTWHYLARSCFSLPIRQNVFVQLKYFFQSSVPFPVFDVFLFPSSSMHD